jgi:hypothetical protein
MPHFLPLQKDILPAVMVLLPFTQENAVDLHNLVMIPLTLVMTVRGKYTDLIKNISLYPYMMRFFFVFIKPEIKSVHRSNHMEHYRKSLYFLTAQNTTALKPNVLVTNKGQSLFPSANYCQDQLQTPRSLSVLCCLLTTCIICIYLLYLPVYFAFYKS